MVSVVVIDQAESLILALMVKPLVMMTTKLSRMQSAIAISISVCLSVCPMPVLCVNERTYRQTFFDDLVVASSPTLLLSLKTVFPSKCQWPYSRKYEFNRLNWFRLNLLADIWTYVRQYISRHYLPPLAQLVWSMWEENHNTMYKNNITTRLLQPTWSVLRYSLDFINTVVL